MNTVKIFTLIFLLTLSASFSVYSLHNEAELKERVQQFIASNSSITTDRLTLNLMTQEDIYNVFALASNEEIVRHTAALGTYQHTTIKDTQILFDRAFKGINESTMLWFTIHDQNTGLFLGITTLYINTRHARAEYAVVIDKPFWGKGIGTEILKSLITFCFKELGLVRVEAECDPRNICSKMMIEKSGMKFEGYLRNYYMVNNEPKDRLAYAIIPEDLS